ncbi:MAG: GHKL domain-containing protein [Eubacterium sp.]|nr:GHKL domain-containing protein [Eubacterium sp.]
MLVQVLSFLHHTTTLLFGIYVSAFFLGVKQERRNVVTLFLFFCACGLLYLCSVMFIGDHLSYMIYPLVIHLPVVLFLRFYYKFPLLSSLVSLLTTYMCCQISNWIGLFFLTLTQMEMVYYSARIITTILTFIVLARFVCHTTSTIFRKDNHSLYIFGFLPFVYYIFDYSAAKWTSLLYSGNKAIVEFLGFALCISYLLFLFAYFQEYEQKERIRQDNRLMEMQLASVHNEIIYVQESKQALSILRHDMRHHLNLLLTLLQNNHTQEAVSYITNISASYEDTIVTTYSKSDMLNAVLSIYHSHFAERNISFTCQIDCEHAYFSELAFCTILSNALENALHALEDEQIKEKWVTLKISEKGSHLLISLENALFKKPHFVDGIPISKRNGHGIGVKSILYYVKQLHGQCHFRVSNNTFLLQIII